MQASQRAESMNSLFSAKVNAGTSLQEFIRQYEIVMEDRYEGMRREDFESRHKTRNCDRNSYLEDHAAEVYTRNMYLEFYSQLSQAERYRCVKVTGFIGPDEEYIVRHVTNPNEFYTVNISMISVGEGLVHNVGCSCGLFEWNGLLCRHIIKLFNCFTVVRIPEKYILKRWCKDASRPLDVFANLSTEDRGDVVKRVLHLNHFGQQIASLASKDDGTYQLAKSLYQESLKRIVDFINESEQEQPTSVFGVTSGVGSTHTLLESQSTEQSVQVILNPNISKTKGRKKENKRWKSSVEVAISGRRRCGICRETGHNATTCKKSNVEATAPREEQESEEA